MGDEIPARDRIEAFTVARQLDDAAAVVPWMGWFLRPFAKALRWMATEEPDDDIY